MKCQRPNCPNIPKQGARGYCRKHWPIYRRENPLSVEACVNRVKELRAAGYSLRTVSILSGVNLETIGKFARDEHQGKVIRFTQERIMSVPFPEGLHLMSPRHAALVCGVGTMRRLRALAVAGYSFTELGEALGVTASAVSYWARGDYQVTAVTAARVKKLFDELQMIPGNNKTVTDRALRKGWIAALAWDEDDMDNPNARPHTAKSGPDDWTPRFREYQALGLSVRAMAQMEGVSTDAIYKRLGKVKDAA
jgi:transcriptional regulator with XRE-family HTH domain